MRDQVIPTEIYLLLAGEVGLYRPTIQALAVGPSTRESCTGQPPLMPSPPADQAVQLSSTMGQ